LTGEAWVVSPVSSWPAEPTEAEAIGHLRRPCGCVRFEVTEREAAVLEQLAAGRSTTAAARSLFVSPQAVTYHVGNLLAKFQCTNRTGLVSRAFVLGVLSHTWPPRYCRPARGAPARSGSGRCTHRVKDLGHGRGLA
jgi:DNA-binding CsgD family transcriptional regulator